MSKKVFNIRRKFCDTHGEKYSVAIEDHTGTSTEVFVGPQAKQDLFDFIYKMALNGDMFDNPELLGNFTKKTGWAIKDGKLVRTPRAVFQ